MNIFNLGRWISINLAHAHINIHCHDYSIMQTSLRKMGSEFKSVLFFA